MILFVELTYQERTIGALETVPHLVLGVLTANGTRGHWAYCEVG